MSSNSNISLYILLALLALGAFIFYKISKHFKVPKIACVSLTTGGVKSGKSTFSVYLAISTYKRIHRRWKVRKVFQTLFNKPIDEEPVLYSNIPLSVPYVPITLELLQRKIRPRYGSVAYVNEASLLCDQMLFKDDELNERLTLFNKLFGHETCGGYLVYDTQCIGDVHYAVKRSLSNYFYVHLIILNSLKLPKRNYITSLQIGSTFKHIITYRQRISKNTKAISIKLLPNRLRYNYSL